MNLKKLHWIGIIFTIIVGTLLHFTYEWSGYSPFTAFFSAINESVWEHLKLLAVPMLFFSLIELFFYKKAYPNFLPVRIFSILLGMAFITLSFYGYTNLLGRHLLWVDILIFLLAILISYSFSYFLLQTSLFSSPVAVRASLFLLIILIAAFLYFSYFPPEGI